jgi:hypothetical protein
MKIKVSEATKEERTNLFNFLVNRLKDECENSKFEFDIELYEDDEYLDIIKQSISIQKFEIELDGSTKIIFNRISFIEDIKVEELNSIFLKPTGRISKVIFHNSFFYEFVNDSFIDISKDDMIPFGYY